MRIPRCLLLLLLPACAAAASPTLRVEQAWIRAAPPGAAMLAGYATLHNDGDAAVLVKPCASAGFEAVSLHETTQVDGISRMRPLPQLEVPAHATVALQPGGLHLMLEGPKAVPEAGGQVALCLAIDGVETLVAFAVRRTPTDAHQHH